jgi:hypothetical protein
MKCHSAVCVVMSLALLCACGTSEKPKEQAPAPQPTPAQIQQQQKEADKIIDQQLANVKRADAARYPCSLFPQQEIEALVGNPLDAGNYTFNNVSEDDHSYKSERCDWSGKGGEGSEAGVWVSLPKHFDSGKVECSPGSVNDKISGIGDQAWWHYQKAYGMAALRVCSTNAMLEVNVTVKSKEEAAARKIAQTMAEKVLTSQ